MTGIRETRPGVGLKVEAALARATFGRGGEIWAPDVVGAELGEPQVVVGAGGDTVRFAGRRGDGELGHRPGVFVATYLTLVRRQMGFHAYGALLHELRTGDVIGSPSGGRGLRVQHSLHRGQRHQSRRSSQE